MPEGFTPLEDYLRATLVEPRAARTQAAGAPDAHEEHDVTLESMPATERQSTALSEVVSKARRFRAALAEALDLAVQPMLKEIAREVLGRELKLRPADITAIVARIRDRSASNDLVSVRARSENLDAIQALGFAAMSDDTLPRGRVHIELHSGTIDMTMPAKLEAVLAACS